MRESSGVAELVQAAAALPQRAAELARKHAELTLARRRLLSAPEPAAVVVETMKRDVDARAAKWAAARGPALLSSYSRKLMEVNGELVEQPAPGAVFLAEDLIGLVPAVIKSTLEAAIRSAAGSNGTTLGERRERLAALDSELQTIEREHNELRQAAAKMTPPLEIAELAGVALARREWYVKRPR